MICPEWLPGAVFYEIYPQSFFDTNGDGIGDFEGIIRKIPYIRSLGVNAIWLNPFFDSPFEDAGYDVRDYCKVAPRYGTNEDFERLCRVAKENGIRILCDLVPCHTSIGHPMFLKSKENGNNEFSKRYIWCDDDAYVCRRLHPVSGGRKERYYASFYECQPALNFGFANPTESWMSAPDAPECLENQKMLCDIMDYWISLGCSGFRVDMAGDLVKNDTDSAETIKVWQKIRKYMDRVHPDCALIPEWNRPRKSIEAGFHMDMNLLGGTLFRVENNSDMQSYFRKEGEGIFARFGDDFPELLAFLKDRGYYSFVTGNHDTPRISCGRTMEEIKCVFAFIFTMPGAPILYYGDEIGMRFLAGEETEGSGTRGGARTPMQWEKGKKNFGFSDSGHPYLPCDSSDDAPCVSEQEKDENSLLNFTRNIIRLRKEHPALGADASWDWVRKGFNYPLCYRRTMGDETCYIIINPTDRAFTLEYPEEVVNVLFSEKAEFGLTIRLNPFGIAVLRRMD